MKKKILTLCLVVALAATAVIGGTLAYFTDTDYNKNVMTTGNVEIDQIEKEHNEEGDLVDFTDDKPLYPVTEDITGTEWYGKEPNLVEKIVSVKNTGTNTAYVRTLFAFEAGPADADIKGTDLLGGHYIRFRHYDGNEIKFSTVQNANDGSDVYFVKDGTRYVVGVAYYNTSKVTDTDGKEKISAIAANDTTDPSLRAVWLMSTADNEFYDYVGDKYDILVLSQAVQTQGFDTAEEAFDAAYGSMTTENVTEWFNKYTESKGESKDVTSVEVTP